MKLFLYQFRAYDEKEPFDRLQDHFPFTYHSIKEPPSLQNAALAAGCDAVSFTPAPMDRALMEAFQHLGVRFLITRSIGYEHIDLEAARELGLRVGRVGYPPDAVADYTMMLLLMQLRGAPQMLRRTASGDFSLRGSKGRSLNSCTVGVWGAGQIGQAVAGRLLPFGCRVLLCDAHHPAGSSPLGEYVAVDRLLTESDILTLHLPASPKNFHLLNAAAFAKMKSGAQLINTARGSLVDTAALLDALESGHLSGAALDVAEEEETLFRFRSFGRLRADTPLQRLIAMPNVILSPHIAFYTQQSVDSIAQGTIHCLMEMESGGSDPCILI